MRHTIRFDDAEMFEGLAGSYLGEEYDDEDYQDARSCVAPAFIKCHVLNCENCRWLQ